MKKSMTTKMALAIPLTIIALCLTLLALNESGTLKKVFKFNRASLKVVEFDNSSLISYSPEKYSQNLLLVNKEHPLSEDFVADIGYYRDTDVLMNNELMENYGNLSDYVRENLNDRLYVSSTYRSFEDQVRVYEEEGPDIAAVPGESEHQTGLAIDLYVMYFAGSAFIQSPVGKYVNESCYDYGFIIRYPLGRTDITGFDYEPWHIRYVGFPHATIIGLSEQTLEEYIDSYIPGTWYSYDNYLISRQPMDNISIPSIYQDYPITCSPDNTGYVFIIIEI